jgi:hypothetical protein
MLIDLHCILSIGSKPMMLITLTWLKLAYKCLELVILDKCVCYTLEAFTCLEVDHLVVSDQSCRG